jgi:hypothetical protein
MRFVNEFGREIRSHSGLYRLLNVSGSKLPAAGIPVQVIQGIKVWVTPARTDLGTRLVFGKVRKVKSSTHRVLVMCPTCAQVLSAGRLHQHIC